MENENIVETLGAGFSRAASVKNIYGEPIKVGEKTIIPVASVAYGFGGGFGRGGKSRKTELKSNVSLETTPDGEGAGGGGGMYSRPRGVYEVTPTGTKFIPANPAKQVITGIVIGFLIKTLFFSKNKKKQLE